MSKPTNIYADIPRHLLENFVWQLQQTGIAYERYVEVGIKPGTQHALIYAVTCPTEHDAAALRDYLHEQAEEELSVQSSKEATVLRGETAEFEFDLPLVLRWVGFMCDAAAKFGCRFDGWRCGRQPEDDSVGSKLIVGSSGRKRDYEYEIIVELPGSIAPLERGQRFRIPIDEALANAGFGEITGGESIMARDRDTPSVIAARLFVGTHLPEETVRILQGLLPTLGCPEGTKLMHSNTVINIS